MKKGGKILVSILWKSQRAREGSALVVALLIMVLLTIIGLSITKTTDTDLYVSKNELFHKVAFYNADSGIYATPKFISECMDQNGHLTYIDDNHFRYLADADAPSNPSQDDLGNTFYDEIMGYTSSDPTAKDIRFIVGGYAVEVDATRTGAQNLAGSGVEFASGAEGVGVGSAGGVGIFYDLDAVGSGKSGSSSEITAIYRKVIGVAGGL